MKVELIENDPCRKILLAEINSLLRKHPEYPLVRNSNLKVPHRPVTVLQG